MVCYVMLCCVMLCYDMLCCVMLCYVMLCYVMLCYVMLCYVMLCYVMLCYVMLCYSICGEEKCKIGVRVNTSHIILSPFSHFTSARIRSPALALGELNDRKKSLYRTDRPFDENMSSTDLDSSLHRGSPEGDKVKK